MFYVSWILVHKNIDGYMILFPPYCLQPLIYHSKYTHFFDP